MKVFAGSADSRATLSKQLAEYATDLGFTTATASADRPTSRIHLVQHLFFELAGEVGWLEIAERFTRSVLRNAALEVPDGPIDRASLAHSNGLMEPQLVNLLARQLRKCVLENPHFSSLFKPAILALANAALDRKGIGHSHGLRVIEWLRGEPSDRAVLRQLYIGRNITRQNARALLSDFAFWNRLSGAVGTYCSIDITAYCQSASYTGKRYSTSQALDLCEMIRQFIDGIDNCEGLFLVFFTSPEFLTDAKRGLSAYPALKMRLVDDVYDTAMPNLSSPLLVA